MKPIRIFQHESCGGLGYLEPFLGERGIAHEVVHIGMGEAVPADIENISGLIFLGSPDSVNDEHAWIADELALIRKAAEVGLPVLGICFGGQLVSKTLGGDVTRANAMQAGWFDVKATEQAKAILGKSLPDSFEVFEWHDDVFSLPEGATPLFYGDCVKHQGFLHGSCLAIHFTRSLRATKLKVACRITPC